ncbi:ParB/RepB/Spo0J family partition protein [Tengunoibacter tsumagoiensis]|uniref:Chromosome partitioning protein ParB n=1 Tax=Tengunoibacter tsumagoiensis TaxID=2014871 RepID=A0A401ZVI9_9CHLR|nr:ParB/RepB/Spo0J family partition protein [Tengunoibacter tsumagoiensis]GCE10760.1 chromosome partitioning protein ParB [Tengunoibacter tsumagoiensis]
MAKQKFGLGRGLDALISGASDVMTAQQAAQAVNSPLQMVPIESILPNPRQPRRIFLENDPRLQELSDSIKEHGLLQPIVVLRMDETEEEAKKKSQSAASGWLDDVAPTATSSVSIVKYQIIAGERRWRASRLAGLKEVPVIIKDVNPQEMFELALIENIQRADLNPIEEALAYQTLVQEFGLTQEQVSKQVGKDRSTITNSIRLLQLAPRVRDALVNQSHVFTEGHARALLSIAREEDQVHAMEQIIAQRLNVRQAEELAARIKTAENVEAAIEQIGKAPQREEELDELESNFRSALMVKVDLKRNAKGKGTLVLHFNNQDELEALYNRLVKE